MNLAQLLRRLAARGQYGHARTPATYYMGEDYCSYYWHNHGVVPDHETWVKVARLSARYRSFAAYCREVLPEWQEVGRIHWADNSVDSVQEDKDGNKRRVTLVPPHGDVCF